MQMTPGEPKQFGRAASYRGLPPRKLLLNCTVVALHRNIARLVLSETYFMGVSAQTPSRPHGCHLKYACP